MGRNKFSEKEIRIIRKLLGSKMKANRGAQKMTRHTLRTVFSFNISDFNVQGGAFGPLQLDECVRRRRIHILDEDTIESMKLRYAEKKQHEQAMEQAEAIADGEVLTDDCACVERLGMKVTLTEGNTENIKITSPFDLLLGSAILETRVREGRSK